MPCWPSCSCFLFDPTKKPTSECCFSCVPIGHNALADTVPRLMREAGIEKFFTNHSLRATATTTLYDTQVDEATIMECTRHRSVNEVCAYKRGSEKLSQLILLPHTVCASWCCCIYLLAICPHNTSFIWISFVVTGSVLVQEVSYQ